jgi:short-subunit dehydrogenase
MRGAERFRVRYGPWALVTGASSGIGQALAEHLAAAGLNVALAARREDRLTALAARLHDAHGVRTRVTAVDLAQSADAMKLVKDTGDLDIGLLAAAAGFGAAQPFIDSDLAEQLEMLDVNCRAVLILTRLLAPRLADRQQGGGIVLFGSLAGRQGAPGTAAYGASKAWVQALGEGLHVELARHGVDVLTVTPGPVHSGFAERAGMRLDTAVTADQVAAGALGGLRQRRMTTSPGALSKLLGSALAPLPRQARTRIMGRVLAGLTADRENIGA